MGGDPIWLINLTGPLPHGTPTRTPSLQRYTTTLRQGEKEGEKEGEGRKARRERSSRRQRCLLLLPQSYLELWRTLPWQPQPAIGRPPNCEGCGPALTVHATTCTQITAQAVHSTGLLCTRCSRGHTITDHSTGCIQHRADAQTVHGTAHFLITA